MIKTYQGTHPFDLKKLNNDALYLHLLHKGYTPEQAERKVKLRIISKMGINESM